ncbi:structural maintenance of chromosomes flexible hinge domain-containing protein GMI1 [Neltuma alba]|uniref:structural maintenance of chromosomes flexible hinge domain-containing protein GMI1 n=1 Tax=Neltuma alba TaxID=207710 RepID=UPI0010A50B68|nr:structural maintenance of chromosomes flexible hinge domain-containing protein GMI1 [Prosopis alba]
MEGSSNYRISRKRKVCISDDDGDNDIIAKVYRFKILLPNRTSIELNLRNPDPEMPLRDFISLVKDKYLVARKRSPLVTKKRDINWSVGNLFLLDANDAKVKDPVRFKNYDPHKCHFLRLQDEYGDIAYTFKNMWDLTPDTNLLLELPEEYTFETALADLIDNSLQAVWSNQENERRLIRIDLDGDKISIFDTGSGMDDTDENSLVKWGKMGASLNRSSKSLAIGGKPPYLKPYFGMFGYGGPIASMHLGRRAVVSSKTKHIKKVYMLHLEREALLSPSNFDLTWKTDGGIRNPSEEENRDSNHGSFTKVEIFCSDFKGDLAKLQCQMKDIYFPYIQCDDMSKTRKTTTPIEFQVNGVDLTEIEGGEVAITNWHSCNGPEFVLQLRFSFMHHCDSARTPGASQEANARLRLVYLPFREGKENIERVLEKLKADGFETKENFQSFSRVSVRRLGRLLPDARWGMLPFMDLRNKKGNRAHQLKRCCLRVKCFIETDGGFKPTPSKTDLAQHNHFTTALKKIGSRVPEKERDVIVEIRRAGKLLTPFQLEREYQDWIIQMHERYDEEVDSGEDQPLIIVSPPNKKALGISSDVARVHQKLKRKENSWSRGEKIKVLKGACPGRRNNTYATIEYFLLDGLEGDAGGEARIICRSMDVPNENGCVLSVDDEHASLDLRSSLSLPLSVIDSGKLVHVESIEWDTQLNEKQQKSPAFIELLSWNHCQELEIDGTLPINTPIFAGQVPPTHVVAVVRPANFMPGNTGKLDQKGIFKSSTEMTMEVKFKDEGQNSQDVILSERISPGAHKGLNGLYFFPLGCKLPNLFHKAGAYVFSFSLIQSSSKNCDERVIVKPSTLKHVELRSPTLKNQLLPGYVFKKFVLEMFDAYGNHVSIGSEVTLSLSNFVIEDHVGMIRKVDARGKIDLSGLLKLTAGFGENASLSVLFEDKIVFEQEFSTVRRKLRITSKLPDICIAGSQLENLVFEVVDPDGDVDMNIHHDDKDGQSHMLIIKSVSSQARQFFQYAFEHGCCTVRAIPIPLNGGIFCFSAAHSQYPDLSITVEIRVANAPKAEYDGSQFACLDNSMMQLQDLSLSFNQDKKSTISFVNEDEELQDILKIGQEIGQIETFLLDLNNLKAKTEQEVLKLQEGGGRHQLRNINGLFTKDELKERIKYVENSAAAVICGFLPNQMPQNCIMDDIINLVALLGTVQSPELSRVLAEYLGEDKMLAVVCRTFNAASALERYTQSGEVDHTLALHAEAAALGKVICTRFLVLGLEDIRPYNGCCQGHDPQRKLTLPDPTLPNGCVPAGFLGYAVNMIELDDHYLQIRTAAGHGLRETVLFSLFRKLQVYETREYMMAARACLEDGAVSLDGGIIKESGLISLGYGNPSICFPLESPVLVTPDTGDMISEIGELKEKLMDIEDDIRKVIKLREKCLKKFHRRYNRYARILDESGPVIENQLLEYKPSTTDNSNIHEQALRAAYLKERVHPVCEFESSVMYQPSPKPMAVQNSSALVTVDLNETSIDVKNDVPNGGFSQAEAIIQHSQKLQGDLQMLGIKIKQREDSLNCLKEEKNKVDDSILDLQVMVGNLCPISTPKIDDGDRCPPGNEEEISEQILQHKESAAGIFCQLKRHQGTQASHLMLLKDVVGVVATLGKVDDDNLSRLLSEYLGVETMLAVVCKTYEGVRALEIYDDEGNINKSSGVHGLGASLGRSLADRFSVICLESLRPYAGKFVLDDPQRKLDILSPRLPNGECPDGFLGFAVNMINVDGSNLFCVTPNGYGLRETLFYNLFSRLQIYKTRAEMLQALPCISDGALSLDGGIIRSTGVYFLGNGEDVGVRFPRPRKLIPDSYMETERQLNNKKRRKEMILEDIRREQTLLDIAKINFNKKKNEFLKFLAESSSYATQVQSAPDRLMPK